jgi:hypothetical protein
MSSTAAGDERQPLLASSAGSHGPSGLSSTRPSDGYSSIADEAGEPLTEEEAARLEEQMAQESAFAASELAYLSLHFSPCFKA